MEILNNLIGDLNKTMNTDIGVLTCFPEVDASAFESSIEEKNILEHITKASAANQFYVADGKTYVSFLCENGQEVILFAEGEGKAIEDILQLLLKLIKGRLSDADLIQDRDVFLKNVLLENELPGDIPLKARDFNLDYNLNRQVFLVRFSEPIDDEAIGILEKTIGPGKDKILHIDEHNIVVLLDLSSREEEAIVVIANQLVRNYEIVGRQVSLGIGLLAENLKDCANSYRQADLALTVGAIFKEEEKIMWYNQLGLGRIIYQLPPTLCKMFLSEVFAPDTYEALDPETLLTIEKFFENNLNGSETSRQLFVHRNTLVYRLDKVEKITGLDLRTFDDAVLFKLAAMVRQYLEAIQQKDEAQTLAKHW